MVQKKAPNILGIQPDTQKKYVKSENRSMELKPSSHHQHPETRNKGGGPEMKKIMKKSRSVKRSEFDYTRSNSIKRGSKSRPEKPPAACPVPVVTPQKPPRLLVTPQKPPQVKIPEASPNYMKSTSSSIARKERSEVSPRSSKTSFDSNIKSTVRKDINSSISSHKPGRTLMKTSSLRPVRTLTKTTSNKGGRALMMKKNYTDQNVRRNTCSSTLKDSKFPPYVALHPGGTEAEGTSVPKVCPYTYCSLNGHHHAPVPPLKCFLKARRRMIKSQKSMRFKSHSSINRRPSRKPKKDIDTCLVVFNQEPAIPEGDSDDFFVEIYAQLREETTETMTDDEFSFDLWCLENTSYSDKDGAETEEAKDGGPYADESSESAISFEDNVIQDTYFTTEEMDAAMSFLESGESETDESIFDASGMDWEEGEVVEPHTDGDDHPILCLKWFKESELQDELAFKPDDSNCDEEAPAQEELQDVFEESYNFEIKLSHEIAINEAKDAYPEIDDLMTIVVSSDAAEYPLEEPIHTNAEHEIELEEQEAIYSELETHVEAEVDPCPQEAESVDLETEQVIDDANVVDGAKETDKDQLEETQRNIHSSTFSDEHSETDGVNLKHIEDCSTGDVKLEVEDRTGAEKATIVSAENFPDQESPNNCSNFNKHIRCKRPVEEVEESREFNPRGPRFLPLEPEEDPETVALRHQMMDERKNAEEWMLDYALRRAVSKLAPARKRKVALLVEAFETVAPLPKYEIHIPHTPTGFAHTRYMLACN